MSSYSGALLLQAGARKADGGFATAKRGAARRGAALARVHNARGPYIITASRGSFMTARAWRVLIFSLSRATVPFGNRDKDGNRLGETSPPEEDRRKIAQRKRTIPAAAAKRRRRLRSRVAHRTARCVASWTAPSANREIAQHARCVRCRSCDFIASREAPLGSVRVLFAVPRVVRLGTTSSYLLIFSPHLLSFFLSSFPSVHSRISALIIVRAADGGRRFHACVSPRADTHADESLGASRYYYVLLFLRDLASN